jgi:hypothetical protein
MLNLSDILPDVNQQGDISGQADVFVSHARRIKYVDLLSGLRKFCSSDEGQKLGGPNGLRFWVDFWCVFIVLSGIHWNLPSVCDYAEVDFNLSELFHRHDVNVRYRLLVAAACQVMARVVWYWEIMWCAV